MRQADHGRHHLPSLFLGRRDSPHPPRREVEAFLEGQGERARGRLRGALHGTRGEAVEIEGGATTLHRGGAEAQEGEGGRVLERGEVEERATSIGREIEGLGRRSLLATDLVQFLSSVRGEQRLQELFQVLGEGGRAREKPGGGFEGCSQVLVELDELRQLG